MVGSPGDELAKADQPLQGASMGGEIFRSWIVEQVFIFPGGKRCYALAPGGNGLREFLEDAAPRSSRSNLA